MQLYLIQIILYEYDIANKAAEEAVCRKARNLIGINRKEFLKFIIRPD